MDFLWMICIFLLAANQNCGCCTTENVVVQNDCSCCTTENVVVQNDCSCEAPQSLMPESSGNTRTAQYPFPPYPVLRE